jgi:hypothetical protein
MGMGDPWAGLSVASAVPPPWEARPAKRAPPAAAPSAATPSAAHQQQAQQARDCELAPKQRLLASVERALCAALQERRNVPAAGRAQSLAEAPAELVEEARELMDRFRQGCLRLGTGKLEPAPFYEWVEKTLGPERAPDIGRQMAALVASPAAAEGLRRAVSDGVRRGHVQPGEHKAPASSSRAARLAHAASGELSIDWL